MKKFISIFLIVLLVFSVVPAGMTASAAGSGVQEKINAIKAVYPSGSYFTISGSACAAYNHDVADGNWCSGCKLSAIPARGGLPSGASVGWQADTCCGFANYVYYCIFGHNKSSQTVTTSSPVLGDLVFTGAHWFIYLSQDSNNYYVYDANGYDANGYNNGKNKVAYNNYYPKSAVTNLTVYHATNYDAINGQAHVHAYTEYVYYWKDHPHYKCYKCSCGDIKENRSETVYCADCEICNPPHVHSYSASRTVAATCTSQGYTVYTCSCGASYNGSYTSINPNNHTFANGACTLCGAAQIITGICGENANYSFNLKSGVLTISGSGKMNLRQGIPWYKYRNNITQVIINSGVTSIDSEAFAYCGNLSTATIADTVTYIGYGAFSGSGLTSVAIPDSVQEIGMEAFFGCDSLTNVTIGSGVTKIGESAFCWCENLTTITIPEDSVINVNSGAFSETPWYNNQPNGVIYIGKTVYGYKGTCPSSVTIRDGVVRIGDAAFWECGGLTGITIPNSVTSIGDYAFYGCYRLKNITIPESLTSIGENAFAGCAGLTSITIPNGVESIGSTAFNSCESLENITIPASVSNIGDGAFLYCTGLTAINVDADNNYYSSQNGVLFNKNRTTLLCCPCGKTGKYLIPDGVKRIEKEAFCWCTGLTGVTIPESVTSIDDYSFSGCDNLTILCYPGSVAMNYAIGNGIPYTFIGKITGISMKNLPNRTEYPIGGTLDTSGLSLTVSFADGTSCDVTTGYEVGDYDFSTAGVKTITVSFLDFTATFDVTVDADLIEYPESIHPYAANTRKTWNYTHKTAADSLEITFSGNTETESGWDYIYIYDGDGNQIGKYSGIQLAGRTVTILGNSFSIRLTSDEIVQYYGFTIVDIKANVSYDLNGDGSIDSTDLSLLQRVLLLSETADVYDVNKDGYFDVRDLVHLKKYLAN